MNVELKNRGNISLFQSSLIRYLAAHRHSRVLHERCAIAEAGGLAPGQRWRPEDCGHNRASTTPVKKPSVPEESTTEKTISSMYAPSTSKGFPSSCENVPDSESWEIIDMEEIGNKRGVKESLLLSSSSNESTSQVSSEPESSVPSATNTANSENGTRPSKEELLQQMVETQTELIRSQQLIGELLKKITDKPPNSLDPEID